MKAIIGVDSREYTEEVLNLLRRMQFPEAEVELVNVVDNALPVFGYEMVGAGEAAFFEARRLLGETVLKETSESAKKLGIKAGIGQEYGNVPTTLIDHATSENADIIAVRASLRGPLDSVVYGGISRSLAMGAKQSVLVVKGGHWKDGPIRAVLATDNSDYSNRAIDHFLRFHAKGFEKICLMTAYEVKHRDAHIMHRIPARPSGHIHDLVEEKLTGMLEAQVHRFEVAGIGAEFRVVKGHANDAIRDTMNDFGGELLILGAHGHSFLEQLLIGSVSLHQVVGEPYSTFLVRA